MTEISIFSNKTLSVELGFRPDKSKKIESLNFPEEMRDDNLSPRITTSSLTILEMRVLNCMVLEKWSVFKMVVEGE